jgi:hypothetical protein
MTPSYSQHWRKRYSATAGLPFDHEDLESRLVWIFGSPRSGSTWLLRQLCYPSEISDSLPLGFRIDPAAREPLGAVPFNEFLIADHVAPVGPDPVEIDGTYFPSRMSFHLAGSQSYALAETFSEIWIPEFRRMILVRLAAALDRAPRESGPIAKRPLLVIKEVNGSHAADVIMRLFPRSRMLLLHRDGRDVIDSRLHALGPGGWLARNRPAFVTAEERLQWVRRACREWACVVDVTGGAYRSHDPALRYELRYESLRGQTGATLQPLLEWLGLPADDERIHQIVDAHDFRRVSPGERGPTKIFRAATPGLWQENLSVGEQQVIEEIIGPRLAALGYS